MGSRGADDSGSDMVAGVVVFAAGSVVCALAPNVGVIIAGRAVMGLGAAACEPGTLSVLLVARLGRRLFSSTLLGSTAGLLLAVDGQHLVLSRTGLLDVVLSFFVLAAVAALVLDRDASRARLARRVAGLPERALW